MSRWLSIALLLTATPAFPAEPPSPKSDKQDWLEQLPPPDEMTIDFLASIDPRTGQPKDHPTQAELLGKVGQMRTPHADGANRELAFSPDGRTLATSYCSGTVRLWDVATGRSRGTLRRDRGTLFAQAFSPDSKTLATVGRVFGSPYSTDRQVRLHDLANGREIATLDTGGEAHQLAFTPDGKTLAVGRVDGRTQLFDLETDQTLRFLGKDGGPVTALAFSPDGEMLLSWADEDHVRLYDPATGEELAEIPFRAGRQGVADFSADGRHVALGSKGAVRVWDVNAKKFLPLQLQLVDNGRRMFAFAPDGKTLVTMHPEGIRRWEVATGKERLPLMQQTFSSPEGLAFSPGGTIIAGLGSFYGQVHLLDTTDRHGSDPLVYFSHQQLLDLGRGLRNPDAERAYAAILVLSTRPRGSLTWWCDSIRPEEAAPERVKQLIADLDSRDFRTRQRASEMLEKLEIWAVNPLREMLLSRPPLEVRLRAERVLQIIDPSVTSNWLMRFHAVDLLSRIGNPAARQSLRQLAAGPPTAQTAREARAALQRLGDSP